MHEAVCANAIRLKNKSKHFISVWALNSWRLLLPWTLAAFRGNYPSAKPLLGASMHKTLLLS
jgi:hypothetical protein